MNKITTITVIGVLTLTGCTGGVSEWAGFRKGFLHPYSYQLTYAGERAIFRTSRKETITNQTDTATPENVITTIEKDIVCAEPSPDVANAINNLTKFATEVAVESKTGQTGKGKLDYANSTLVNIAQLTKRLASVQYFRDRMYRACEAYANGAISQVSYTILLSRMDKAMATMLTAELASGIDTGVVNSLSSSGSFTHTLNGKSVEEFTIANEGLTEKLKAKEDKEKEVAGIEGKLKGATDSAEKKKIEEELSKKQAELELAKKGIFEQSKKLSTISAILMEDIKKQNAASLLGLSGSSVSSSASNPNIVAAPQAVFNIHQNYIDDDGVDPLIDACVTTLSAQDPFSPNLDKALRQEIAVRLDKVHGFPIDAEYKAVEEELTELAKKLNQASIENKIKENKKEVSFSQLANYQFGVAGGPLTYACLNIINPFLKNFESVASLKLEQERNLRRGDRYCDNISKFVLENKNAYADFKDELKECGRNKVQPKTEPAAGGNPEDENTIPGKPGN